MGLFDEFEGDFESIPDPVTGLPQGVYECMVSDVTIEDKDSGKYLVITYTCTEEGPFKGKTQREYKKLVVGVPTTDDEIKNMSYVKGRLKDFGLTPERMRNLDAEDIRGLEVAVTLAPQKNNPQYNNVVKVVLLNQTGTTTDPVSEFAPRTPKGSNPFED